MGKFSKFACALHGAFILASASLLLAPGAFGADVGVTVNGVDVSAGSGNGWTYASSRLTISGGGSYTLGGSSTIASVSVLVAGGVTNTLILDNLVLSKGTGPTGVSAITISDGSKTRLELAGGSALYGGANAPAICVEPAASLAIDERQHGMGASLSATGGSSGAGIGGRKGASSSSTSFSGEIVLLGGDIAAKGGTYSAGIGGSRYGYASKIEIRGGTINAAAGSGAAGIGSGRDCRETGDIAISGGKVRAKGGMQSAGIGGAYLSTSRGGGISISGGTVEAIGGSSAWHDIGPGYNSTSYGSNIFTGGSILATNTARRIGPAPVNAAGDTLYCVTVGGLEANGSVSLEHIDGYGCSDIYADAAGNVHLWLPSGTYLFIADGVPQLAVVNSAAATAEPFYTGVLIDGADAAFVEGEGWRYSYTNGQLLVSGSGNHTLSGTNAAGKVQAHFAEGSSGRITLDNLWLEALRPCKLLADADIEFALKGTNHLIALSGSAYAGMYVTPEASVTISCDAGDDSGTLVAQGRNGGAGIGGGLDEGERDCGNVAITGGTVLATGGANAAGIGGANGGAGGDVLISGGRVAAVGGAANSFAGAGAGIGGGAGAGKGIVSISGGTVFAGADSPASSIGYGQGGQNAGCSANRFVGGSISLSGAAYPMPVNSSARVYCVTVANLPAGESVAPIMDLPAYYGTNGIYADASGKAYLWLPNGTHQFQMIDGIYTAVVNGADVSASRTGTALIPPVLAAGDGIAISGANVSVRIANAKAGVQYVVYADEDMSGGFTEIAGSTVAEADGPVTISAGTTSSARRFYKVAALPANPE